MESIPHNIKIFLRPKRKEKKSANYEKIVDKSAQKNEINER